MMKTKMSVIVTIPGRFNSFELYEDIKQYGASVTDIGDTTIVIVTIDIRNEAIEHIMEACHKYNPNCEVNARMLEEVGQEEERQE